MYTISDLKACYNRHLPNIGCVMLESVGVNCNIAKLFQKVLSIMQHHFTTDYRISNETYGDKLYSLEGTD